MKILRIATVAAALAVLAGMPALTQSGQDLFQQALVKEQAEGDLPAAIALYQRIVRDFASDRVLAAKALVQMGQCQEKLGNQEARKAYERVLEDYPDQTEVASVARARLAAIAANVAKPRFTRIGVPTGLPTQFASLSPDGRQLAYIEKGSVWLVPVHGETDPTIAGAPRQITQPNTSWTETTDLTWSQDGKWLALKAKERDSLDLEYSVYMVSSRGGDPKQLSLEPTSRERIFHDCRLSLSPDGKWLAYTTWPDGGTPADRSVYLAPTNGGPSRRLTQPVSSDPAFSPDGKRIAYLRLAGSADWQPGAERGRELWITTVDGGSPVLVHRFSLPGRIEGPTWSPDGRMLAVLANHDNRTDECREMLIIPVGPDGRASGSPATLALPQYAEFKPAGWSSENQIGLVFNRDSESAIYTVASSGGKAVQLTPDWAVSPGWTPDGRRIYFEGTHFDTLGAAIEHVPSAGGKIERVDLRASGANPVALYGPGTISVSPDGKSVLFLGAYRGAATRFAQIFLVPVEGGEVVELTEGQGIQARSACWSPDGRSIAFIGNEDKGRDIYTRPLTGGQARKLTSQLEQVSWGRIAWSPDGSRIAFYSDEGQKVRVIPVAGGPTKVLVDGCTKGMALDRGLAWSPNGSQLLYGTAGRIWKLDLATGKSQELQTGLTLFQRDFAWSPDGKTIAFSGTKGGGAELWLMDDFLPLTTKTP